VLNESQGLNQIRDQLVVSIDMNDLRGCSLAAQVSSDMEKGEAICVQ
jgi:hypothetical protein